MKSKSRGRGGPNAGGQGGGSLPSSRSAGGSTTGLRELAADIRQGSAAIPWPLWARVTVSMLLVFHLTAVISGGLAVPPSSRLEQSLADLFTPYYALADLGYAYRFYVEPPPTPVVTATLRFGEGRPDETVRLPDRGLAGPRMRHQRQLALANALFMDVQEAKQHTGKGGRSSVARAYARHLCMTRPGCQSVTIFLQYHLIPEMDQVRQETQLSGTTRFDLFSDSLFSTPERIGDYSCADF